MEVVRTFMNRERLFHLMEENTKSMEMAVGAICLLAMVSLVAIYCWLRTISP